MHGNNQTSRAAEPPMYESEVETSEYRGHSPKIPNLEVDNKSATRDNEQQVLHADKQPVLHHLDAFKETSHGSTAPATAHKAVDEFRAKQGLTVNTNKSGNNKTLSETVTAMLVPANNMVSDATNLIASKIQKPTARDETGAKMVLDKGISVKEYLRSKLEPGEEDRALSEVITDAISSRKGSPRQGGETSVVEKVREAASTLLRKEEPLDEKQLELPENLTSRIWLLSKQLQEHIRSPRQCRSHQPSRSLQTLTQVGRRLLLRSSPNNPLLP